MLELRGYIVLPAFEVEQEAGTASISFKELEVITGKITRIALNRFEVFEKFSPSFATVFFLADFGKLKTGQMEAIREIGELLRSLESKLGNSMKVDIFANDDESEETIVIKLGDPSQPID